MRFFDNMTVKLSGSLVLIAFTLMILVSAGLGLFANQYSRQAFGTLNQINVGQAQALNHAYVDMLRARVELNRAAQLVRKPSFDRPGPVIDRAEALMNSAKQAFQHFLAFPAQPSQVEPIETLENHFQSLLNTGLSLQLMVLKEDDVGAYDSGQSRVSDMSKAFMESADAFFAASEQSGNGLAAQFERISNWMNTAMGSVVAITLLLVLITVWGVTVNVIRPLRRLIEHFRQMAAGDLSQPIETKGDNEIGQLYSELAQMQQSLATTVGRVRESSATILDSAQRTSEGNQELSSRTQQQASSLEQTAASLDELTATVAHNADNSRQAAKLADDASSKARAGGEVISNFVDTVSEINERSTQIHDTIALIDNIAYQTNLLALNASVEAARAGEHGRGFAVVASEVRSLASRSAAAANDVRRLIDDSRQSLERGNALSAEASQGMETVIAAVGQVNDLMEQIAQASNDQHRGIEQLNQAMNQMETLTQQDAQLVEKATNGAMALENEAEQMRHFAARFTTRENIETDEQALSSEADSDAEKASSSSETQHQWSPRVVTDKALQASGVDTQRGTALLQ
ncbi:Methyl-accepting chemotaxis protein [Onishia taeanensis]|uniref:Methyl-accepting chemotaxis protein n=1 Tax=Onishia taeanensis TaxID=284577 RepID=A0A1G7RJR8_9GAMM|nr:methyl-accepting chemotaxis protein [Halomonas taeanensis]SDG10982.1 Methyl-accepting chemotaxis protein [Halomonas taeanensis]